MTIFSKQGSETKQQQIKQKYRQNGTKEPQTDTRHQKQKFAPEN